MLKEIIEDYSIGYPLDDSTIDTKPLVKDGCANHKLIEDYNMPESDKSKRNRRRRENQKRKGKKNE